MARGRRKNTVAKVREMRRLCGGRKRVVREMRAASVSTLKRWDNGVQPIAAHILIVNATHKRVMGEAKLRRMVAMQAVRDFKRKEKYRRKK